MIALLVAVGISTSAVHPRLTAPYAPLPIPVIYSAKLKMAGSNVHDHIESLLDLAFWFERTAPHIPAEVRPEREKDGRYLYASARADLLYYLAMAQHNLQHGVDEEPDYDGKVWTERFPKEKDFVRRRPLKDPFDVKPSAKGVKGGSMEFEQ